MKSSKSRAVFAALALCAFILSSFGNVAAQIGGTRQNGLVRGQDAINRLGARLPEVAARLGQTAEGLRRVLLTDSTLWVDPNGMLLYVDEHTVSETEAAAAEVPQTESIAPFPLADTFLLNSKPGSSRTIYLDFDGHTTSGTGWNASYTGGADIVSAPFDEDGSPSTFNDREREIIQLTWQRMAEDYAPFDVNVTTQDPGEAAIIRATSSDTVYGTRCVFSATNFTGSGIGGIAYVGVFNYVGSYYQPAFVMTSGLGSSGTALASRAKFFAEAGSHEVGHNLGLSHDGTASVGYYEGHGVWAPIMGVGYYREVSQWSRGEYPGANQTQDDIQLIQNYGAPLRTDDHGNTTGTATAISSATVNTSGIISTRTDVDYFSFVTGAGNVSLNFTAAPPAGNLNISVDLLDSNGAVVASSNPAGINAAINTSVSAGTYYLKIDGVGEGDLITGYSDYGSLGAYKITGTLVSAGQPIADATATNTTGTAPLAVQFSSTGSSDPDGTIVSYAWNFGNGATSTDPNPTYSYTKSGNFTATLTVTDNSGFSSSDTVAISVTNTAPIAVASANVTSGPASLAVAFSSAGSSDADGNIASYLWNFGNGATSTAANPTYTYTTAGTYSATVRVTDNLGASTTSAPVVITVTAPVTYSYISAMTVTKTTTKTGTYATVTVTVRGSDGAVKRNAVVTGTWSGLTTGTVSGTTNRSGQFAFKSATTRATSGTFTFTVNGISLAGFPYDATKNTQTTISIAR